VKDGYIKMATRPASRSCRWAKSSRRGAAPESPATSRKAPVRISCNQVFYELLALKDPSMLSGFVHLPCSHELAIVRGAHKTPSLSFEIVRADIELLVTTALEAGHGA